ncbi:MAG: sensor histidine kinase [Scytonema sp. PMC 1070.18]|nr:sensor histidine kinase [Scytonema sp. PMC 1070.18]
MNKIIYTLIEIALILLCSFVGGVRLFAFLYIILVIRNCLTFERPYRYVLTGISYILCLLTQSYRFKNIVNNVRTLLTGKEVTLLLSSEQIVLVLLSIALIYGLVLVFLQLLVETILSERHSREKLVYVNEKLEHANAQLRRYALHIEDIATLQERNRIAREIHDSLGHSLTILNLHLEAALKLWKSDSEEAIEFLEEAKLRGSTALTDIRQSVSVLRSDPLEGLSIEEAISSLTENFRRSSHVLLKCSIEYSYPISPEIKTAVYRIVQEALTNIFKYAEATEVEIKLYTKSSLHLLIADNGKGFNLNQNTTGFGIQGMRERTLVLGGKFQVITAPNQGCRIIAHFPLPLG